MLDLATQSICVLESPAENAFICTRIFLLTSSSAALWAGALTPVASTFITSDTLSIPGYQNTTCIREWPSENTAQSPMASNEHGVFSYSAGLQMQASLLHTAASSSTTDGRQRRHNKHDLSQFTYIGRSYGVGASVGLEDKTLHNDWSHGYDYHEAGLYATVKCRYNTRGDYQIRSTNHSTIYRASGKLQDSDNTGADDSLYLALTSDNIVAVGVPQTPQDFRRRLAIAAGKHYSYLNSLECTFDFEQTLFRVAVNIRDKTIAVEHLYPIRQFYPGSANLTYTLLRQFAIIANLQSSTHVSALGDAFSQSITNYVQNSRAHGNNRPAYSFKAATLAGVETALVAMADDMLVAYAGAQMYVQKDTKDVVISVTRTVFRFGDDVYIYVIFGVNLFIALSFAVEWIRTKNWEDLPELDYLDPGALIVASASHPSARDDGVLDQDSANMGALRVRLTAGGIISLEQCDSQSSLDDEVNAGALRP